MSPATRRRASARWSWWATSSACRAALDDRADRDGDSAEEVADRGPTDRRPGPASIDEHAPRRRRRRGSPIATVSGRPPMIEPTSSDVDGERLGADRLRGPRRGRRSRAGSSTSRVDAAAGAGDRDAAARRGARRSRPRGAGRGSQIAAAASPRATDAVDPAPAIRARATSRSRSIPWRLAGSSIAARRSDRPGDAGRRRTVRGSRRLAPRSRRRRSRPRRPGAGVPIRESALGGGEEPLEVAQPVAPVAARVDPVVAKPAGVAPGPDRVRVHAEEASGLRHGEGRVDRAGRKGGWQAQLIGGNVKSVAEPTKSHSSCQ